MVEEQLLALMGRQLVWAQLDDSISANFALPLIEAFGEEISRLRHHYTSLPGDIDVVRPLDPKLDMPDRIRLETSYAQVLQLGVDPFCIGEGDRSISLEDPYQSIDGGLSDPLQIAAMYVRGGSPSNAKEMLRKREELIRNYGDSSVLARRKDVTWVPTLTEKELGALKSVEMQAGFDSMFMEPCFTEKSYRAVAGHENLWAHAMIRGAQKQRITLWMQEDATDEAYRSLVDAKSTSKMSYPDMVWCFRLLSPKVAETVALLVGGVRRIVGISRSDVAPAFFQAGVKEMATTEETTRATMSSFWARAPSIQELKAVRNKGVVDLLDQMPMPILQHLLDTTDHDILRNLALPHLEVLTYDVRERFLTDHPKRARLISTDIAEAATSIKVDSTSDITQWNAVTASIMGRYHANRERRKRLLEIVKDPFIALIAVLAAKRPDPILNKAIRLHPRWSEISNHYDVTKP